MFKAKAWNEKFLLFKKSQKSTWHPLHWVKNGWILDYGLRNLESWLTPKLYQGNSQILKISGLRVLPAGNLTQVPALEETILTEISILKYIDWIR